MRRLFQAIQPTSKSDCVFAGALIRPVATTGGQKGILSEQDRNKLEILLYMRNDAIGKISKLMIAIYGAADMYRRAFAKHDGKKLRLRNMETMKMLTSRDYTELWD